MAASDRRPDHAVFTNDKFRAVAGTDVITIYALEELIRPHLGMIA